MRPRHALILLFGCSLAALQSAAAAETSSARFLVSVRATVTKNWSYTSSRESAGCRTTIIGKGQRTISLRSRDLSTVTARWPGGDSLVRFSGSAVSLGGSVRQAGTKTTRMSGPAGCTERTDHADCVRITRTFENRRAELVSRRRHRLSFRRMKALVPRVFFNDCPGEPRAVRSISGGLNIADANFSERDLFDRTIGGITLEGTTDVTNGLFNGSANVVQHVHWTLTLRRLGG